MIKIFREWRLQLQYMNKKHIKQNNDGLYVLYFLYNKIELLIKLNLPFIILVLLDSKDTKHQYDLIFNKGV